MTTPASKSSDARQIRDCRSGPDPDTLHRCPCQLRAVCEFALDPGSGFPCVAAYEEFCVRMRKRLHQRRADAPHRLNIKGKRARRASDSIGPEKRVSHST